MIGVIADDLSGAAELAGVGWRHGLRSEIVLNARCDGAADLVCVDTDSRGRGEAGAIIRARGAGKALREAGAEWIYKKVDSALRGHVVAEVNALMAELNFSSALLVPANPSLGRVIREGKYFVRGQLLHETEFARDPRYPRTSSTITELLRGVCVRRAGEPVTQPGITAGEAASPEDLRRWASVVDAKILPAGAAEFFGALLAQRGLSTNAARMSQNEISEVSAGRELFVCGSTSESAKKFCEASRQTGAAVFSLPEQLGAGADFDLREFESIAQSAKAALAEGRRVILRVGLPLVNEPAVAAALAKHLVQLAGRVLEIATVGRVYAEGGETAALLARRMGWGRLDVLRELAPGVVVTTIGGSEKLRFALKPGTYEWPAGL